MKRTSCSRLAVAVVLSSALAVALAPARVAFAAPGSVTLSASATAVSFGASVRLSGQISPAASGETIDIIDATGAVVAHATSDATGSYTASFSPSATVTVHADWQGSVSPDVTIAVRVVVTVDLGAVRLFDRARVRGTVAPIIPGATVDVTLTRGGNVVATKSPAMGAAGRFQAMFPIERPGIYRVHAAFADPDHLRGTAFDGPRTTPLPSLQSGASGTFVVLLERRLVELHYRLVAVDRTYDDRTADAVLAFRKVQRMPRLTTVDPAVWRALADPIVPKPRGSARDFHIEIDQTRQVLYTVKDGSITNIIHVSTGKQSTPTPDGSFFVFSKLAGFSSEGLYYPSFFDGARAIHGWTDVPAYPASHGCVRVPYWNAQWIYGLAPIGTKVLVYHE